MPRSKRLRGITSGTALLAVIVAPLASSIDISPLTLVAVTVATCVSREMPLAALFADAAVNPKFIAEYTFPGVITGFYTHLEYIKLAP